MSNIILITGASSGFGKAIAETFAAAGWHCIITGRRAEKLTGVADNIRKKYSVPVLELCFDVQDRQAAEQALSQLPNDWQNVEVLVNNAGLALGRDSFENASLDDWDRMIDTNLKGLVYVTKFILPLMIKNKRGHIINIGSTAAKDVYKDGNMYCATKHAVDAISRAQRIDLLQYNIKVTAIHPGAVADTEFSLVRYKGDASKVKQVYQGYKPLSASDVAGIIYFCATLPSHVCINDLVLTCTAQADNFYFHKVIPA